jgi:FtsP/CotA-like multicopper oxidase with cupredoxin domain
MKRIYWVFGVVLAVLALGAWWLAGLEKLQMGESRSGHGMMSQGGEKMPEKLFQNPDGLPEAKPTEEVLLKDGEVFDLTIAPVKKTIAGRTVGMFGYNGSVPGPIFRIPEGAEVTINLKNEGNIPTTLHSHGVRVENAFDGVPDVTQKEIAPGESFAYKLKFSDPGVFWYHPHVRTDYAVEAGLYGSFIVTPKDVAYWSPVNREASLLLDDIALDKKGVLPFESEAANHALMGRFGNVMLVNGQTDYRLDVQQGEVVRLYLTNVANTRLFNVSFPGAKMKLVGGDLSRYAKETWVDEVLVAPGERRVVDVLFEKAGEYTLTHQTPGKKYALGKVVVSNENISTSHAQEFSVLRTNGAVVEETGNLIDVYGSKDPDKRIRLTMDMNSQMRNMMNRGGGHMMGSGHMMSDGTTMPAHNAEQGDAGVEMGMGDDGDAYEWEDTMMAMNETSTSNMMTWKMVDEATGKENMDINDWMFKTGDKVKIRIFNDPKSMHPMQHPIHFHGQRLLVLSTNGVGNENPAWQDTVLVAKGDTVDILLEVSNSGKWMAHCHILEHAEAGMMLPFAVK